MPVLDTGRGRPARPAPALSCVGERIPCRDAHHRVWQALDLVRSHRPKPLRPASPDDLKTSTSTALPPLRPVAHGP